VATTLKTVTNAIRLLYGTSQIKCCSKSVCLSATEETCFKGIRACVNYPLKVSANFMCSYSFIVLYGCETWKLTKTIIHQLQVLVNRYIRRILTIFWPVQISNQEPWARAKQKPIELEIRQRKWGWLGHTFRRPPGDIAKAALEWNPQGTRSRGRPRATWRRTILEGIRLQGKTWNEVKALERNRVRWRNFVRALCSLEE
jgi:hypothetical protein